MAATPLCLPRLGGLSSTHDRRFFARTQRAQGARIERRRTHEEGRRIHGLLASLQAYVIVSQPEQRLEVHRRTADGWSIETHLAGARVALPCGVDLVVSELYP